MIPDNFKQSLVIAKQLPDFIRDEEAYQTFILFLSAYYEWMEQEYNISDRTKNLLNYKDIDNTLDEFEKYFFNEFLQYFPKESLTNKRELVKFSKELYQRKGTISSFKFLFKALYNSDCEIFNTRDFVLVPSSGKWVISKSIKINTLDDRFLQTNNYKIVGEISKSIAKIERSQIAGNKIQIFLSDIEREFNSGEYIRIVDNDYNDVYINGANLRSKIIGSVASIKINKNYPGLFYNSGDPVIIYNGLNPDIEYPTKAIAKVGDVTRGSINNINVLDGGHGYSLYPNTIINFINSVGSGAAAKVTQIDNTSPTITSFIPTDIILPVANTTLDSNTYPLYVGSIANANSTLLSILSNTSIITYPISSVSVTSPGYNYTSVPTVETISYYNSNGTLLTISSLGICSPITITFGGYNYSNGDIILCSGGSGYGAYANVKSVDSNGSITTVQYIYNNDFYPLGGLGYNNSNLPSLSIQSANNKIISYVTNNSSSNNSSTLYFANTANVKIGMYISGNNIPTNKTLNYFTTNTIVTHVTINSINISTPLTANVFSGDTYEINGTSILKINSILGEDASLGVTTDSLGEILTINLINNGEDYISQPDISLKIMDIVVTNVNELNLPEFGELIYQGDAILPNFVGYVDSINKIYDYINEYYYIRIYNYNGLLDTNEELFIDRTTINSKTLSFNIIDDYNNSPYKNGIITYGDGKAIANANFINGTVSSGGQYLNSDGHLSSYCVLQNEVYNNFTYILSVEKAVSKYKDMVYNLLHPVGIQIITRNKINSNNKYIMNSTSNELNLVNLLDITNPNVYVTLTTSDIGTNKVSVNNLNLDIIDGIFKTNTYIKISSTNNQNVFSKITIVDSINSDLYLQDYVMLKYSNIAYGYTTSSNSINISSLTGKFNLINNGNYQENHLKDIFYENDYLQIGNNDILISNVDYTNWIIYSSNTLYSSGNITNPQLITIKRNFISNNVVIYYNIGDIIVTREDSFNINNYVLITETDDNIYTEDGIQIVIEYPYKEIVLLTQDGEYLLDQNDEPIYIPI